MGLPKTKLLDFCLLDEETVQGQIYHPFPLDWVPLDEQINYDLYIHIVERKILFRKEGDILTPRRVKLLRQQGVDSLYVTTEGWAIALDDMGRRL